MLRPVATVALLFALALMGRGDTAEPRWIDRPAAQPWLPALQAAADRANLPVALVAELIGQESGFRNVHNPHSSASGFGQQIARNAVMIRYGLHPMRPADSIMGAALELRERIDATGSLPKALRGYGTTAGMTPARRRALETRFAEAAKVIATQVVAQQVGTLHIPRP